MGQARHNRLIFCAALVCVLPLGPAVAAEGVPVVRGEVIRDYARITFEWPKTVYFTADAKGKTVSITFDRKADPDFRPMLSELAPHVVKAERKADGRTVVLTLDRPYRVRTFVSDGISGIDLLDIHTPIKTVEAKTLAELAPAAGEEPAPPDSAPDPIKEVSAAPPAVEAAKPESAPAPEPAKPEAGVAETKAESAPPPESSAGDSPSGVPAQPSAEGAPEVPTPPGEQAAPEPPSVDGSLKVDVSAASDSAVLRFPLAERTGLVVFKRAHMLWVVLSSPQTLNLADFDSLPSTVIGKAEQIPHGKVTILRLPVNDDVYAHVAQEQGSFAWAVLLTAKRQPLEHPLKAEVNTDPPAPAHVFIGTLEMGDPVIVRDPQVGDELALTPLFKPGEGIAVEREFTEFTLLSTAQGIVVAKKAEEVAVVQLRNGLRVSMPGGATLTPGLPEISSGNTAAVSVATLFPYEIWKSEEPDPIAMRKQRQELFHRIVVGATPQEANEARLRMAQIYLSDGMAVEALGLIDGINRTNPAYYRSAKIAALRGAANFLLYRFPEAARDFAASELNNNKEVNFWRNMLADLLGSPEEEYDYLALNQDYISKYPPLFRQRLAIVAADRAIDAKEYNRALKVFDVLQQDRLLASINAYINFLLAKVSVDTGQADEATKMWDKLAADYEHPFVQARAEFSRIAWGMEHGTVDKDQAIDRLERLRLAWHGDSLELKVLTLLGELYSERKDYVNAMRIWHGGIQSFPNTAAAIDMSRKMQEVFIVMFNEGIADQLPPLEALALYYEYRNYTPAGTTGNQMIERLADRLVAVDLLDQAASLLDHQMHFQTEKEERSRIGVKLANVYLLNHEPQKALAALQDSLYGDNPLLLRLQRNRLAARAMVEMGQYDRALATLGQDNSVEAEHVRLSVYWLQKDWPKLTASIEELLRARPDVAAPVSLAESEYLLKLSLAYVFENNRTQLRYLRDYFGPLMEKNPNRPVFDFIAGGDIELTTTNFDALLKYLGDTRSFIEKYNAHLQTAELEPKTVNQ